jgi:hypothetical protein
VAEWMIQQERTSAAAVVFGNAHLLIVSLALPLPPNPEKSTAFETPLRVILVPARLHRSPPSASAAITELRVHDAPTCAVTALPQSRGGDLHLSRIGNLCARFDGARRSALMRAPPKRASDLLIRAQVTFSSASIKERNGSKCRFVLSAQGSFATLQGADVRCAFRSAWPLVRRVQ